MKLWPNINSKIMFNGTTKFWFTNMVEDANKLLEVGKDYTVSKIELASSWCGVILKEFPEHKFSLSWFNYPQELTTNEIREIEGLPRIQTIKEFSNNYEKQKK